ncbi:MAG: hypothetical protein RL410_1502 [Actinomycetota bacterium]|jgi:hypothetical protein
MIPLLRFQVTNWRRDDRGNAVVGFAIGAPIVTLLASYAIGLMAHVWSRNIAAEIVRDELHQYAIHASVKSETETSIRDRFARDGLNVEFFDWPIGAVPGTVELQVNYTDSGSDMREVFTIAEVAFLE